MGEVKYVSQNFIYSALSDVKIWHSGKQYLDQFTICLKNLLPNTADDSIHLTQCDWYQTHCPDCHQCSDVVNWSRPAHSSASARRP